MPLRVWRDRNFSLVNLVVLLGFMSFTTSAFWLSLYMQNVLGFSPLTVAIHLLPQAIGGIVVNIIAGLILHRVNNKLLTGIGALAYLCSAILLATMKKESSYWAFIFPSLLLSVIGADLEFNVANVHFSVLVPQELANDSDVRDVFAPSSAAIFSWRHLQYSGKCKKKIKIHVG